MAKKTHPHKRSSVRKAAKRKPSALSSWIYRSRTKIALVLIASALLATAALAYWKAPDNELVAPAPVTSETANKSPVKDVPTLSEKELADIPPEAFHPQPPMAAGYNAHNGGLPPGALPAGVVLPGMPMMQGGRTTAQGYGMSDGVRQQFTSKERDNETRLDYFGARYYSSVQGRFTSVDPVIDFKTNISEPQRWNQYHYALNNPLRYVDPNGQSPQDRLEIEQRHDETEFGAGRMSAEEFLARAKARGAGGVAGATIVVGALLVRAAPAAVTGLLMWMAGNPDAVQQLGQDALQMSTGNPAPASVPRLNPEQIEQFGTTIARDVMSMGKGQMTSIAARVTECGVSQAEAWELFRLRL